MEKQADQNVAAIEERSTGSEPIEDPDGADVEKQTAATNPKKTILIVIVACFQLLIFITALDKTIIATSLPTIGSEFKAVSLAAWVINGFGLAFNAFQVLFTKLSDIFGRKNMIMLGILVFILGSALCGAATTMVMLIAARVVQGIGAASIFSITFVIIADLVPLEKRSSYQGVTAATFMLGSVAGPLIGGALTDHVTWRWSFYLNLPLCAVSIGALFFALRLPRQKQDLKEKLKRIDYAGNFLVISSSTLFLLALNFGGQAYPWNSAPVIVLLVISAVLVPVLALVEIKYAKEPMMPPRLFKKQYTVAILLGNAFFGMSVFPLMYNLPIYFQAVRGDSATWSGIRILPMEVALGVFGVFAGGSIAKFGVYRPLIILGISLVTAMIGLCSLFSADTSWPVVYVITFFSGAGAGIFSAANTIAMQAAVDESDVAVAIGLRNFAGSLGSAIGIAIASTVLNSTLKRRLMDGMPAAYAELVVESLEFMRNGLPPEYLGAAIHAYNDALRDVWHSLTIIAGLGWVSSFFAKNHPLKRPADEKADVKQKQ